MANEKLDSRQLKAEALRLGFSRIGLAPAEPVPEDVMADYERWLREGRQAGMHYLENHLALRRNPALLLPGAVTVVSLAISYNPGDRPTQQGIAWYAQGRDYHDVVRERLRQLVAAISLQMPLSPDNYRICVDTAPLPEKYWAWRCGLGWIGRHRQLVIPHEGSAFFLAELLLTCEADRYDTPLSPQPFPGGGVPGCGTCRRCLEACPTSALTDDGLDARRCLSYLTIEHRGPLPDAVAPYLCDCFYGCDRCLRACPHLSRALPSPVEEFRPSPLLLSMSPTDWERLSPDEYRTLFRGSAVKRAKYEGLMRNIRLSLREPSDD
ncbi:MAG: tRNA epoxyqueuosine(34) reductase QueG [Bacteroidaceae bacterium]|nr:tRNA epoxyqueuosine(34) reductase QueG [Bacteroidaceae bacterium]